MPRGISLPVANNKSDNDASFLLQSLEVLAHGNPRASQVISAQPGSHTLQQMMQSLTLCHDTEKGLLTLADMKVVVGMLHAVHVCITVLPISKQGCHLVLPTVLELLCMITTAHTTHDRRHQQQSTSLAAASSCVSSR